ncbi:hypothetical protein LIER_36358 [Lithospermum erythrorhizon]|uniref:Uncharacterized protein n=1 Tax=Lithospermum erythrorhizon TaxID=34254 RepID=A0AAV3P5M1_LITER
MDCCEGEQAIYDSALFIQQLAQVLQHTRTKIDELRNLGLQSVPVTEYKNPVTYTGVRGPGIPSDDKG